MTICDIGESGCSFDQLRILRRLAHPQGNSTGAVPARLLRQAICIQTLPSGAYGGLMDFGVIQPAPQLRNGLVDDSPRAIDRAKRAMLRQSVPRRK
jgi:hypothetical protein